MTSSGYYPPQTMRLQFPVIPSHRNLMHAPLSFPLLACELCRARDKRTMCRKVGQVGNPGSYRRSPVNDSRAGTSLRPLENIFRILIGVACLLAVSVPGSAHHGAAGFDAEKQLTMKAIVTDWLWANPHCYMKYDTTDEKGDVVHWAVEVSNPTDMTKRGWSLHSFKPGDEIMVTVRPAKNGALVGQLLKVVLANGQTLIGWGSGLINPPGGASNPGDNHSK